MNENESRQAERGKKGRDREESKEGEGKKKEHRKMMGIPKVTEVRAESLH